MPEHHTTAAFVVGIGTDVLSIVRNLGARGVPCWVCCSRRIPGAISRYTRFWRVPDPQADESGMIERVQQLSLRVGGSPIIFTGADHYAQALARHRDRLEKHARVCIAHAGVVELLTDKQRFSDWARIHVPSYPLSIPASEFIPGGPIDFPVIVKPCHRGVSDSARLAIPSEEELYQRRFTLIRNENEWQSFCRVQSNYLPYLLVQQYIAGTSASKYSICLYADRRSEIKGVFVGRRIRGYPALYGDATLVQSDRVPKSVIRETEDMVKALNYTGIAEVEFNCHANTGAFHLLEMNARCWGWIGLTNVAHTDILWIAYSDLAGDKLPTPTRNLNRPGEIKMVFLAKDVANVFIRYRWNYPSWVLSPRQWWQSIMAKKLVVWEWDRQDKRGSLWCLWCMVQSGLTGLFRKMFASG